MTARKDCQLRVFAKITANGLWLGEVAKCAVALSVGFAIFAKPLLSAVLFSHLNNYQK